MLRRIQLSPSVRILAPICSSTRSVSTEHKEIIIPNAAPKPPMMSYEPVQPMDFNPHIEWFEFPKEFFDPKFPMTREDCIAAHDILHSHSTEEMAQKYGLRFNNSPKAYWWASYVMAVFLAGQFFWGAYRSMGFEPWYGDIRKMVMAGPNCPQIEEDDLFLDQWHCPMSRRQIAKEDWYASWKPPVKRDGAKTSWQVPFVRRDVSEWIHMTLKN